MSTATQPRPAEATPAARPKVGPERHGLAMDFDEFTRADFQEGWLFELARGIVMVSGVPGIDHTRIVARTTVLLVSYAIAHPNLINFRAGSGECRVRLPGMRSDRCPDQAVYLHPKPTGTGIWARWIPQIVVEVTNRNSEHRDYEMKRAEYLLAGVSEYWILNHRWRSLLVLLRLGDTWEEHILGEHGIHRTELLPGLEMRVGELLGPPVQVEEE